MYALSISLAHTEITLKGLPKKHLKMLSAEVVCCIFAVIID